MKEIEPNAERVHPPTQNLELEQQTSSGLHDATCCASSFSFVGYAGKKMTPHYEMHIENEADRDATIRAMLIDCDERIANNPHRSA